MESRASSGRENLKSQTPNLKFASNEILFGAWKLELLWDLSFEVWSF